MSSLCAIYTTLTGISYNREIIYIRGSFLRRRPYLLEFEVILNNHEIYSCSSA
nr:MAG TPA: hypothetical protein [Caudoviricetes sp.]